MRYNIFIIGGVSFMKLCRKYMLSTLLFALATILPLFLWSGLQGVDNLYMYAHAKDMLANGLVRTIDIFSMHENLSFSYQKWAACILTYFIVHNFGWNGLTIATYILIFALLFGLYLFGRKFNGNHMLFNTAMIMSCAFLLEANGTLRFRPHVIAGIIFIYMFYILEQYVNGLITADWKFYLRFIIASVILMWFHSTMWIMFIVVFLPYVFNFSRISHIFSQREYKMKPLLISMVLMFVAGVFNPNGLKQYQYMWACLRASGSTYSHVDELQPMPLPAYLPVLAIGLLIFVFMVYSLYVYHIPIYMPSVYLVAGSLIMPLISWRLVFYSALFITIACMTQTAKHSYKNLGLGNMIMPLFIFFLSLCIVLVGFSLKSFYNNIPDKSLWCGTRESEINDTIDLLSDRSPNATVFNVTAHVGSYSIYKGLRPYMDCRAEVYDINVNKCIDVLSEIHDFSDNMFHDVQLDEGGILLVNDTYNPDYYVLTRYSDADMNIKAALDNTEAFCLYAGENVWIYSFEDSEKF